VTLQWAGLVLAVLTFGTIGLGHVAVRKLNHSDSERGDR
jgi:hypothetical protein